MSHLRLVKPTVERGTKPALHGKLNSHAFAAIDDDAAWTLAPEGPFERGIEFLRDHTDSSEVEIWLGEGGWYGIVAGCLGIGPFDTAEKALDAARERSARLS